MDEQQVPLHIEMDEYDDEATHFVGYNLQQPIAAGRIREIESGIGKVERVSVLPEFRGQHVGVLMMEAMEKQMEAVFAPYPETFPDHYYNI